MEPLLQLLVSKVGIDKAQAEKVIALLKEHAAELPKWLFSGASGAPSAMAEAFKELAQKVQAGPMGEVVKGLSEKVQAGQVGEVVKEIADKVQAGPVGDVVKGLAEKVTGGLGSLLNQPPKSQS